ncbi:PKD domain containing protein, partial [Rhodopirellula maiorica SM1]
MGRSTATLHVGTPFIRDLLATDADGDPLTFSLSDAPTGVTVSTGGVLHWTPDTLGDYTFTASASDGQATTTKTFTFTVAAQASNAAPRITSVPNKAALASAIYRYDVNASDAEGDTLVYSLTKKPAGMQINYTSGLIQWIPTASQVGNHEVTVSVNDLRGGVDNQTFVVNVGNVNRPPVIDSNPPAQAIIGKPFAYPIRATDPDGHALTFSIDAGVTTADTNGNFSINSESGLVSWIPDTSGTYRIQINVVDAFGLGTGQIFDVDVLTSLPNNPPRFMNANPPLEIAGGETYSYDFSAIDPDDDALTFSLPEGPSGASINATTGVVTWDTTGVTIGTLAALKVVVSDGAAEATYRYSVRVQPANVAPYFSPEPDDQSLIAGQTMRLDVKAYDVNTGDVIQYSLDSQSQAMGMSIDNFGRITWVTDASDITSSAHPVTVTISDGLLSSTSTLDVTVAADTNGPTIQLIASSDNLTVGDYVDLRVYALDNVAVTERTLTLLSVTQGGVTTVLGQSLSLNAAGQARLDILASHMGTLLFEATAKDAAGNNAIPKQLSLVV